MNHKLMRQLGLSLLLTVSGCGLALAAGSSDFVDEAAQGGINEVESAKLALEKSTATDVKAFAQQMVDDHTKVNQELMSLAHKLDIKVPDEASLTARAKKMILEMRDESFDQAYIDSQVEAHEKTVALFEKESQSKDDAQLKAFAQSTLPQLRMHLDMAKRLQTQHAK